MLKNKLFGDRAFYKYVLALSIPMMIQNGITHLVSMLDNLMIGVVGKVEMNGVYIANQLLFVFNLCVFGAVAGAGIFGAQFAGQQNHQGIAHATRFKLYICTVLTVLGVGIFLLWDEPLILLYLQGEGDPSVTTDSLSNAQEYLRIMLLGLPAFALSQCYAGTLRETGRTTPPMVAGVVAVVANLVGNGILIYGLFGAPALGVKGAAIATVLSRFVELAILVVWTHANPEKNPFAPIPYRSFRIPLRLVGQITLRGLPLMLNEAAWSLGLVALNRQYTVRDLDVVSANSIAQIFWNVFSVSFMAVGVTVGIILGQKLGNGDKKGAKEDSVRLIVFSTLLGVGVTVLYCTFAPFIPHLYQGEDFTPAIRTLATQMMIVGALSMPIDAFAHATYFTLRSGGQVFITILFDSVYMWVVNVPVAFLLMEYTTLPFLVVYAICHGVNILKCILGGWLVKKGIWVRTIVEAPTPQ